MIMKTQQKKLVFIKFTYWLGIVADALWFIALLFPSVFGLLLGNSEFNPAMPVRLIMGIGASLMLGWTFLLIWAVRRPIERRVVSLLTAFPVVTGLFIVALLGFIDGNSSNIWILAKTTLLFICMLTSYFLASKMNQN